jgi:tRNA threonylcarbamoyladenosine biosynthesis protein TsaB
VLVLAIETATDAAAVAVADADGVLASLTVGRPRRHAEKVAPAVVDVCRHAGVALRDVDAVAVDVGPGLFTGLRVGVGAANAFAFALGVPVVAVGSLEVLAAAAADTAGPAAAVVAVVDARRGEVFWARYRVTSAGTGAGGGDVRPDGPEQLTGPGALAAELATRGEPVLAVGDGAWRYTDVLLGAGAGPGGAGGDAGPGPEVVVAGPLLAHPPVSTLASLAVQRLASGVAGEPGPVLPRYRREADARINWETRRSAAPAGETA